MSADLLAEFDTFYQAPHQKESNPVPALNTSSILDGTGESTALGNQSSIPQWQASVAKPNHNSWGSKSGSSYPANAPQNHKAGDDIWGSFGGESDQIIARAPVQNQPYYGGSEKDVQSFTNQRNPDIVRKPSLDLFSSKVHESSTQSSLTNFNPVNPPQTVSTRPAPATKNSYGEVLFDADDMVDGDDDDFGDFETGAPEPAPPATSLRSFTNMPGAATIEPKAPQRSIDLLSTIPTFHGGNLPYPDAPKSPSFQERNPFANLGLATHQINDAKQGIIPKSSSPITAWPSYEPKVPKVEPFTNLPTTHNIDEDWGDFSDLPSAPPAVQPVKAVSGIEADAWAWDSADQVVQPTPMAVVTQAAVAPPTNVPPPSIILALFPPLFDLPQSTLFKAVTSQQFSLKNRIISDPSTIEFLRGYLLIATVAARIIAGRKLRWKRDSILSQAMKIGPAAAGGKGGMKLTGVDKAEVAREDREATDVVRVWKEQLGRLRSAIAVANSSMHDTSAHLAIPDISDNMYVKALDRAVSAPKPCVICGLKREERINKVDIQVEDSFGEWWVDHWGHRACRNFWVEHEPKLKLR